MGEVYRARDARLDREVAVKVLPGDVPGPDRVKRFEREARAAGALNHPNVLTVHDVGTHEGAPYLVTELLSGKTLRERLLEGRLPLPQGRGDRGAAGARALGRAREGDRAPRPQAGQRVPDRRTGGPRSSTSAWPT